ncbi:hypothetical protein T265_05375 [Opisthorchis viverrini]|uniref:UBC core domain-containing protein n=1 Tax=Opisthorchis viverrini TaxID=6198 RepID=A0A074ZK30_OPIVI|nr:hypothetical protein T265_05375 [Opisthorchis viverrini]KER27658.1 hypothetical protein T265_05375 [Opisthorchis viverrini]
MHFAPTKCKVLLVDMQSLHMPLTMYSDCSVTGEVNARICKAQIAFANLRHRFVKSAYPCISRLQKELMELLVSSPKGITAFPDGENLTRWLASIQGPDETVYEGQRYKLSLEFGPNYPYSPPTVRFVSRCYHPNVDHQGAICLDILKEKWSPLLTVENLLLSIRSLLAEPNNDSPLNGQAAQLWNNPSAFRIEMLKFQSAATNSS